MTRDECEHGQLRRSCEICELRAELNGMNREAEEQSRLIEKQASEIARLRQRIESAPVGIMDTRDALGVCAPTEEDFPALYALQGKRVRLVVEGGE